MRTIRLTPKQKEVIELMRKGWELSYFVNKSKFIVSNVPWLEYEGVCKRVGFKISDKLLSLGLITKNKKEGCNPHLPEMIYSLTHLGKTINLE